MTPRLVMLRMVRCKMAVRLRVCGRAVRYGQQRSHNARRSEDCREAHV